MGLEKLATVETLLFSLAVFAFSYIIRRAFEFLFPVLRGNNALVRLNVLWRDVLLPTIPAAVGILYALCITSYPYPEVFNSVGSRVIYGLVCGFFCTWGYKTAKAAVRLIFQKLGQKPPDDLNSGRPGPFFSSNPPAP